MHQLTMRRPGRSLIGLLYISPYWVFITGCRLPEKTQPYLTGLSDHMLRDIGILTTRPDTENLWQDDLQLRPGSARSEEKPRENRAAGRMRSNVLKRLRLSGLESGWKVAGNRLAIFSGFAKRPDSRRAPEPSVLERGFK